MSVVAVGTIGGYPASSNNGDKELISSIAQSLASMKSDIEALRARMAPQFLTQDVSIPSTVPGKDVYPNPVSIGASYNGILVALTQGIVNIYWGGSKGLLPDLQVSAAGNPVYVPLPERKAELIRLECDAGSGQNAMGKLFFLSY